MAALRTSEGIVHPGTETGALKAEIISKLALAWKIDDSSWPRIGGLGWLKTSAKGRPR